MVLGNAGGRSIQAPLVWESVEDNVFKYFEGLGVNLKYLLKPQYNVLEA